MSYNVWARSSGFVSGHFSIRSSNRLGKYSGESRFQLKKDKTDLLRSIVIISTTGNFLPSKERVGMILIGVNYGYIF